jgi:hypothetical protein
MCVTKGEFYWILTSDNRAYGYQILRLTNKTDNIYAHSLDYAFKKSQTLLFADGIVTEMTKVHNIQFLDDKMVAFVGKNSI